MKLVTIQWRGILDILKQQGVYFAQYGYGYRQYIAQYQNLSDYCGFSHCPIFCATEEDTTPIEASGIKEDEEHIKIYLEIPESRYVEMDYYAWSDYLYYSSGEEYDSYFNFSSNNSSGVKLSTSIPFFRNSSSICKFALAKASLPFCSSLIVKSDS